VVAGTAAAAPPVRYCRWPARCARFQGEWWGGIVSQEGDEHVGTVGYTMEQKFRLLSMTEELKAEYAAHQLQGPAGIWWSHHRTTYPVGTPITWNRFTTAFRGNYIPSDVVEMKVGEFMRLS